MAEPIRPSTSASQHPMPSQTFLFPLSPLRHHIPGACSLGTPLPGGWRLSSLVWVCPTEPQLGLHQPYCFPVEHAEPARHSLESLSSTWGASRATVAVTRGALPFHTPQTQPAGKRRAKVVAARRQLSRGGGQDFRRHVPRVAAAAAAAPQFLITMVLTLCAALPAGEAAAFRARLAKTTQGGQRKAWGPSEWG